MVVAQIAFTYVPFMNEAFPPLPLTLPLGCVCSPSRWPRR